MAAAQARILRHLARVCAAHPAGKVVLVSHCDIIRCALLHYLRRSLDCFHQIDVEPAAISTLVIEGARGEEAGMNQPVIP
jgi:probable phosphoglycerate mutase